MADVLQVLMGDVKGFEHIYYATQIIPFFFWLTRTEHTRACMLIGKSV